MKWGGRVHVHSLFCLLPLCSMQIMCAAERADTTWTSSLCDFAFPRKRKLAVSAEAPCKHVGVACSLYSDAIDQGFSWLQARQRCGNAC